MQSNYYPPEQQAYPLAQQAPPKQTSAPSQTLDIVESHGNDDSDDAPDTPSKRTGRRKIKIEYIEDKSRRHITFSKRKAGIMKKAYELSTLTGTQVLLLVVSETGLVYTFTTPKLQPLVTKPEGKNLIQSCLNAPDANDDDANSTSAGASHTTTDPAMGSSKFRSPPTPSTATSAAEDRSSAAAAAAAAAAASPNTYGGMAAVNNHHPGHPVYYSQSHRPPYPSLYAAQGDPSRAGGGAAPGYWPSKGGYADKK